MRARLLGALRAPTRALGKPVVAATLLALAVLRLTSEQIGERMDETFVALVAAAILALVLPWERLTSVKAVGVEVTLDVPQVTGAIRALGLDQLADEALRLELSRLRPEIEQLRDARVLWVDDVPGRVHDVRRVLRAFGVDVVMATSTREAHETLERDNDFDLIVSNVERRHDAERVTYAWLRDREQVIEEARDRFQTADGWTIYRIHEGVNYALRLRRDETLDPWVRTLPVLFYSGFDWARLVRFTAPALATSPATDVSRTPQSFLAKAIRMLAKARSERLVMREAKEPV